MKIPSLVSTVVALACTGAATFWLQARSARLRDEQSQRHRPPAEAAAQNHSTSIGPLSRKPAASPREEAHDANLPVPQAKEWTRDSLESAGLAGILAEPNPMDRLRGLLAYAERLPTNEIAQTLSDLRAGSPEWDAEAKFAAHLLLSRWGKEDPESALASLKTMDLRSAGEAVSSILASVSAADPELALAWLNDPDNKLQYQPKMGDGLAGTIAKEWVRQDPEAAYAWAASLPAGQRDGALGGLVESLAGTDPESAANLVLRLEDEGERQKYLGDVSQSWGRQQAVDAMAWARSLKEQGLREEAIDEVLDGWAQRSPAEAAAYVDSLPDDRRDQGHISEVAKEWARRDPAEAAAWLTGQEEGQGKTASIAEVMANWTTTDPVAASTWLAEQPPSDSRDAGAATLARVTFDSDPEAALSWGAAISNEKFRGFAVEAGLREWGKRDADAAQAWAAANNMEMPAPEGGQGKLPRK